MPSTTAFEAAVQYVASCDLAIDAFLGVLCGDGMLTPSDASGNGRFSLSVGCSVLGGREYLDLIFFPMLALLAPRFRTAMEPYLSIVTREGVSLANWCFDSSRSVHWGVLYQTFYVDGLVWLDQSMADVMGERFLAYFAMGVGEWNPEAGMVFRATTLHPGCRAAIESVFERHGISTFVQGADGRPGCHLRVSRDDLPSMQRLQELARTHFPVELLHRAGLGPDGGQL
jgi:hypothetical protein